MKKAERVRVNVGADFSLNPAGRFADDGPASGEIFRDRVLVPLLQKGGPVDVYLDDAEGYGSSFLEEVFGGLVRTKLFAASDLRERLKIFSDDESMIEEIWEYVNNAEIALH
jgi:hypothetical protein